MIKEHGLETGRVQALRNSGPLGQFVNALSVLLLLAVEHGVLVSWQHLGLGGHLSLPSLDQLDGAHLSSLISSHGGSARGQTPAQYLTLPRASTMSAVVERSVCLCVEHALALGGLSELFGSGLGGADPLCGGSGGC